MRMDKAVFYKNDKIKWRKEGDSELIVYYNNKFMRLNETASEIFHYCRGADLAKIVKPFTRVNSHGKDYLKLKIRDFLKKLLNEGVIIAKPTGETSLRDDFSRLTKEPGRGFLIPQMHVFRIGRCDCSGFPRPSAPLRVFFTLTKDCNLSCKTCYNDRHKDNFFRPQEDSIKIIIDRMKDSGVLEIILTGGEPFLYQGIFNVVDYILSRDMKVRINTNGLLLTDEYVQEVKKRNGVVLTVGIDGTSEKTHDFIRGKGNFRKVVAIMQKLSNNGIPLYINFTVTHKNISEIWRLRKFSRDFNIIEIIMNIFIRSGQGHTQQSVLALTAVDLLILKTFGFLNRFASSPEVILITSCYAGYVEANVDYKGLFYFCELLDYPLGNVLEKKVQELWNSSDMASLMNPEGFKEPCRSCFFRTRCKGSCRAEVFFQTGDLYSGNPHCLKGRVFQYMRKSICR